MVMQSGMAIVKGANPVGCETTNSLFWVAAKSRGVRN